ncbi:MAG: phosphatase PAP2 family protein [Actinobacteria bacterium]|nr:phosphatase PAP2 family protein [Actinomycetota bacterium]
MLWQFDVSWQAAAIAALALFLVWVVARRSLTHRADVTGSFAREAGLILGLFSLWQLAGDLSVLRIEGAVGRGRWLWHAERLLHLPNERTIQHALLPHHWFVQFTNMYYGWLHFPSLVIFLFWVYFRHREHYASVRNAIVAITGACLLIQLIPVAPPRLVPGLGVLDTPAMYGQSVYGPIGKGVADQLSAMPSVHVGWAVLIAVVVWRLSRSRWRWIGAVHAAATFTFVATTGNHYWLDGIVSIAILAVIFEVQRRMHELRHRERATVDREGITVRSTTPA